MTNSIEPMSNPNSSEDVQTTIPRFPSLNEISVSSLTSFDNDPWCNSMLIDDFSFNMEAKNSASPLVLVKRSIGESKFSSETCSIILSATSEIVPLTNFTSTSYFRTEVSLII